MKDEIETIRDAFNDGGAVHRSDVEFLLEAIDASRLEVTRLTEALEKAASQLEEVRTGSDFECECWAVAEECRAVLAGRAGKAGE